MVNTQNLLTGKITFSRKTKKLFIVETNFPLIIYLLNVRIFWHTARRF